MSKFIDDLKQASKSVFSSAKVKAEELGKIGKAKGEIVYLKQKLAKAYSDLGEVVRPMIAKDKKSVLAKEEPVKEALKKLAEIEKAIKAKEKEIETARKEAEEQPDSGNGKTAEKDKGEA